MTEPSIPPSSPETPAMGAAAPSAPTGAKGNRKSRSPLVAALLLLVAVLVTTIGVLAVDRNRLTGELDRARQGQSAASAPAKQDAPAPKPTTGDAEAAPSQTRPELLELIRKQPRRDPSDGQALGAVDAKVVMVLYSDFACPYCTLFAKQVEPGLADLVKDGTLRIEWRDLAQITATSPLAARAGRAAAAQGRFWEFHDAAYGAAKDGEHPEYTEESLLDLAKTAGVPDLEAFRTTMNAQETADAVAAAKQEAYGLGVSGTPFMFIGDAYISGYKELAAVRATVEAQAAASK